MQLKNKWWRESSAILQRGHSGCLFGRGQMELILEVVGSILHAIFHKNRRSLSFKFNFQSFFQKDCEEGIIKSGWFLVKIERQAEPIEYFPDWAGVHKYFGLTSEDIWSLIISCAEKSSNREKILVVFHWDEPGINRSEMSKEGSSLLPGFFGAGLKLGKVGIQAVVQTGKWEVMETCRHVPDISRDLHRRIPFQSHEAFTKSGEDRNEPYLIYF